ncbi:hypothetical protein GWI33_007005 [Rhynchophorus ferrugineus]|uniref:Uncharacterized protein n=1 Tax=Rhynchophorus ferrugineus TaxID=354439 RepID=A0A834MCI3_RHYFE|nr:hypothetical protein GWI33_007005 [Rhynchophorus ferrugineus]
MGGEISRAEGASERPDNIAQHNWTVSGADTDAGISAVSAPGIDDRHLFRFPIRDLRCGGGGPIRLIP